MHDHTQHASAAIESNAGGGAFQVLQRESYNYFVAPQGMGPAPYTMRVTDVHGHVVEDSGIALQVGAEVWGE